MMSAVEALERAYRIERLDGSTSRTLFRQLANLHIASIHGGILEALGPRFVGSLYYQLSRRGDVLMYVAFRESRPIGFVAGSGNLGRSVRKIGIAGFGALAAAACMNAWRPSLLRKIVRTGGYFIRRTNGREAGPRAEAASNPARAELLAIAVAKEARGQGVGKSLVTALECEFQNCTNADEYFVSTNREEIESNAFYRASGFTLVGERRHHDLMLNIYKKELISR
jgi:ribosomal protein S18 acetylase RimI-like enzyme